MRTHQDIDRRSLAMAQAIVARIDAEPERLQHARDTCRRWLSQREAPALLEWEKILECPWSEIRNVLLDPGEEGQRLRQIDPFCGILTPQERWAIYRSFRDASPA